MRVLDLFSGIGGFSLGLQWAGMETVAFCEQDQCCQKAFKKHWPNVSIYDDIKKLTGERLKQDGIETIDLISGGFPCQPFSQAGKRKGKADDRDLWPEMFRVIQEVRPAWVIGENVVGFVNMELERTLIDLESAGFETQSFVIPACAIGAKHRRDRVWIVAYYELLRDAQQKRGEQDKRGWFGNVCRWELEPDVGRVAHGIPSRVDRLKGLGNAVVPQVVEVIGRAIMDIERNC